MEIRVVKFTWLSLPPVTLQPLTVEPGSSGTYLLTDAMTLYDCVYTVMNYSVRFILLLFSTKAPLLLSLCRILTLFFVLVFLWVVAAGHSNLSPPFCRAPKFSKSSTGNAELDNVL